MTPEDREVIKFIRSYWPEIGHVERTENAVVSSGLYDGGAAMMFEVAVYTVNRHDLDSYPARSQEMYSSE